MKKFKLIEETQYMLTDETRSDRQLNAVDLNLLAILQYVKDGKTNNSNWFNILIKHPKGKWDDDRYTSIEKYFDEFGVKTDYTTLNRSINKLQRLGYIEYKTGFYNNNTKTGMTPRIIILKGTINIDGSINCSDIAIAKENSVYDEAVKLIIGDSDSYSDIAIAKEKEKYKEKENKDTYNLSTNKAISDTYDISTYTGDNDDEDLEYVERYGIGKLSYILQHNDDWFPALEYLQKHPTKDNYDKIEAYWSDNDEYLEYLHNFNTNSLRITV